ncbi:Rv0909 family putative TA system antitoxin [Crossiella cryophila]|uniref:Antitoxin n=1 Tax=Crossiella cryophila TaxID=43355 RepID=A0A7W7CDA7_9PSEU|nr:Rv0909 family putative TA system antitoxin [Crossiella cryophila]MBB4679019.1 hypothetical protein [Crossiella cryophila]
MSFLDKAKELAEQAKEKAAEFAQSPAGDKARELAAKGVDAAASGIDKVTGGKYTDKIETVSNKVEGFLDKDGKPEGDAKP